MILFISQTFDKGFFKELILLSMDDLGFFLAHDFVPVTRQFVLFRFAFFLRLVFLGFVGFFSLLLLCFFLSPLVCLFFFGHLRRVHALKMVVENGRKLVLRDQI